MRFIHTLVIVCLAGVATVSAQGAGQARRDARLLVTVADLVEQ